MPGTEWTASPADDRAIRDVLRHYHAAMVDARTADLDALLEQDFALVHLTGYVQPKAEWFDVISSGDFDYHQIDVDERSLAVTVADATAVVTGRAIFDATIHGTRRPWRLQFTMQLATSAGAWRVRHARYRPF